MADYVKAINFTAKDNLPSGDPNKKVRGVEINDELAAIQTAVASKLDKASPSMTGTPLAPSPTISADNTQIATTEWVRDLLNVYEPLGIIKAWAGTVNTIPTGWSLCNGTNGTVNLTDRFIAGFGGGTYGQNTTGGHAYTGVAAIPMAAITTNSGGHSHSGTTEYHTLTINEMPPHNHGDTLVPGNGSSGYINSVAAAQPTSSASYNAGGGAGHRHGIPWQEGHEHSVFFSVPVPGYFALAFIQKTALL